MAIRRHKWVKQRNGKLVYWECPKCGCVKQKDWGLPWFYFHDDKELPHLKAPPCNNKTRDTITTHDLNEIDRAGEERK